MRAMASLVVLITFASGAWALDTHAMTRIAFGSCADEEKPQPIWDAVLAYKPELFIFAGDNVYGDVRDGRRVEEPDLISSLRESYARAAAIPGFMMVKQTVPHLVIWDDHDFGLDDAGAEFAGKSEAKAAFLDFWNVPAADGRRSREGVYHAQAFGASGMRTQVILLDTRFFRSPLKPTDERGVSGKERYVPDNDPNKTMLGPDQWAWLEDRLREPADLRLIVSSIQVVAEGHGWERWGNLPRERQRLYDLIRTTEARGVLFLSGDRHMGALYRETEGTPYSFLEITSSGLNQLRPAKPEAGPNRLGDTYEAVNFGTVEIDWGQRSVALSLRDLNGKPVRQETLSIDSLAGPGKMPVAVSEPRPRHQENR
jgi:alkaline phosphatase D